MYKFHSRRCQQPGVRQMESTKMTSTSTDFPEVYLSRSLDVCYTKKSSPKPKLQKRQVGLFHRKTGCIFYFTFYAVPRMVVSQEISLHLLQFHGTQGYKPHWPWKQSYQRAFSWQHHINWANRFLKTGELDPCTSFSLGDTGILDHC